MEIEEHETPQKVKSTALLWANNHGRKSSISSGGVATPKCSSNKKGLHPRTPNGKVSTSVSCSSFHIFPASVVCTPPAKRFHRVRNPFEAAWADRLHLPVISSSPSLFQPPVAPHLSSTIFEWTIDEVSSLKPANVEPHETQFQDSPDPDAETKAQSAISSYFKEQQIVPSPVDCPLRSHRIILSELNGNTPLSKPGRRIRDCGTQTELTLPAILPKALEDALRPYFQPHLAVVSGRAAACTNDNDDHHQLPCSSGGGSSNSKDISLRRKLFDMHNIIVLDNESKSPNSAKVSSAKSSSSNSSPLSVTSMVQQQQQQHHTLIVGKLSDSLDKSSFGSLSPISASDGLSPQHGSATKRKSRLHNFLHDLDELDQLSPIHPPARSVFTRRKSLKNTTNAAISKENYRTEANTTSEQTFADISAAMGGSVPVNKGKFTPDRSSSPLNCLESAELSIDSSFNIKVSRLMVNSSKCSTVMVEQKLRTKKSTDILQSELSMHLDDTVDILDGDDDDDMQVSQLSAQSSNSSSNSDTPRSKRRSASRKNLSQSFSLNWLETEEEEQQRNDDDNEIEENHQLAKIPLPKLTELILEQQQQAAVKNVQKISPEQRSVFYRTDSGFNEMSSSSLAQLLHPNDEFSRDAKIVTEHLASLQDVSMLVCCSTPSKHGQGESSCTTTTSAAF